MSAGKIDVYLGTQGRDAVIEAALGVSPESLRRGEGGKPYITNGAEFNLSHSGGITVCAVSNQPVGVDIELIKPREISLLLKVFCADDAERINAKNGEEKLLEFYRCWTVKEAVCKLSGKGINKGRLKNTNANNPGCFCKSWIYNNEYVLTLCAELPSQVVFHVNGDLMEEI